MVLIDNRQDTYDMSEYNNLISIVVQEVFKQEDIAINFEVSVSIVDECEIKYLNYEYRKTDKVTDVLSFPLYDLEPGKPIDIDKLDCIPGEEAPLGDIVICFSKAVEQSIEYAHSVQRELSYLLVHGTLHLLGYDHMDEEQTKIMRDKEEKVLDALSIRR